MPLTARRATPSSRRSACNSSIALDFRCGARFSRRPLLKLSTTRTVAPRWTSASTSADPMNEAPPVTSVRVFFQFIFGSFAISSQKSHPPRKRAGLCGAVAKLCFCCRSGRDKASCSRLQRRADFLGQEAARARIALLPSLTKDQPRCSSRKSDQRPQANQSYRSGEQSFGGEYRCVQDLYSRDFLGFLHLGKLVLLRQQLVHGFFNFVLSVQVRVGHSQQREFFDGRSDESVIACRISGIASKLLQLLVQLADTCFQGFHTYVAFRINLLEAAQLGLRGNQLALQCRGCFEHCFALRRNIERCVLAGEFAKLFRSGVEVPLHFMKPAFQENSFAPRGGRAELRDE